VLQLVSALVGGIFPGLLAQVVNATIPTAGVNVSKSTASSSLLNVAIGAILTGLGASGFGADAIHTVTTIAGLLLTIVSTVNHLGLLGAANANTEALIEQLLTQIASYQPPVTPAPQSETSPETGA
jgi:hypothetical protein